MFELPMPGLFVVRYTHPSEMDPLSQPKLIEAIRAASSARPVAVVFVLGPNIRRVDFAVPTFWIKVMGDPTIRIGAMAMVTESLAVKIAAKSFGTAYRYLLQGRLEVETFEDERSAASWVNQWLVAPSAHV